MSAPPLANTSVSYGRNYIPGIGTVFGIDGGAKTNNPEIIPQSIGSGSFAANLSLGSSFVDPGLVQRKVQTITSAQLLVANTTPTTVLAAPGAGLANVLGMPLMAQFTVAATSVAYTVGGNNKLQYHTGAVAATATWANTTITGNANSNSVVLPIAAAAVANDAIEFTSAANYAGGNGTLTLDISYRICAAG